ncbi:MAG: hypothetical protein ABI661_11755 [Gammaproteobacteria bacterium]
MAVVLASTLAACGSGSGSGQAPADGSGTGGYPGGADIIAWGDSWTSGVGAVDGMSYPDQLATITGRPVFNAGVSGQTSDQIAARQGSIPALLTLPNDTLPGSGPVMIEFQSTYPVSAEGPGPITGTLAGIHGTLSFAGGLVFESATPGAATSVPPRSPFIPDTFGSQAEINVFWNGGNNFYDPSGVQADIAASVAFLSTGKFIVLAILNPGSEGSGTQTYAEIVQLNADLAATYPANFIDIRAVLVAAYDPASAEDVRDHARDVPPASFRNDDEHLNEAGYGVVAETVAALIRVKGW